MGIVYAGTSGWAYPVWKPSFYPAKLASAKFLGYYASRLNSTEVNYTFRRFPTEKLLAGWAEGTPAGFKFAIKAHQSITHIKRLKEAADSTAKFIAALQPLHDANKLGPVLFQLPPFLKCDSERLENFLAELPKGRRVAFEFRDASWFNEEVFGLLRGRTRRCAWRRARNWRRRTSRPRTFPIFACGIPRSWNRPRRGKNCSKG